MNDPYTIHMGKIYILCSGQNLKVHTDCDSGELFFAKYRHGWCPSNYEMTIDFVNEIWNPEMILFLLVHSTQRDFKANKSIL